MAADAAILNCRSNRAIFMAIPFKIASAEIPSGSGRLHTRSSGRFQRLQLVHHRFMVLLDPLVRDVLPSEETRLFMMAVRHYVLRYLARPGAEYRDFALVSCEGFFGLPERRCMCLKCFSVFANCGLHFLEASKRRGVFCLPAVDVASPLSVSRKPSTVVGLHRIRCEYWLDHMGVLMDFRFL
jgi:hypothetical protein